MPRDLTGVILEFARTLRWAGVEASPDRVAMMVTAVDALGASRPRGMFWAGRMTLCQTAEDVAIYDAACAAFFGGYALVRGMPLPLSPTMPRVAVPFGSPDPTGGDGGREAEAVPVAMA